MSYNLRKANALFCCVLISAIAFIFSSCSDDDPVVRTESDLVGVWTNSPDHYLYIKSDTKIYSLYLQEYEGETVGMIEPDGYVYEPAYNFIVYMDRNSEPDVYQLISLDEDEMVWCWVDNLMDEKYEDMSKTEILGQLIMEADKGFTLDMSKTVTYKRVPDEEFQAMLDKFGLEI
ncbi:hypothetical protein [Lepagella muris]|jgi:hypothetical protein|uniref:Uncharacterized protein n=1 Tax=Lepagella muris TaxID=3032870 RepID=A0AC61RD43_9BACT|nr:hypothetical protein [Lepagella muris]ROT03499.1 hypothetical protein EEL33_17135 [Muribaculaceae bacterium Isolate-037 (Harlan)]TGY77355.1 hypothetical protein E5331_14910 [Lepagella muris]THG49569.1 hypothetical protein E5984_14430 [Bacteroidales bacterium]TKC54708.1 hypothetical protein E5359_016980 [Bacteroidales bacterium]